jgi:hypothetical protein
MVTCALYNKRRLVSDRRMVGKKYASVSVFYYIKTFFLTIHNILGKIRGGWVSDRRLVGKKYPSTSFQPCTIFLVRC